MPRFENITLFAMAESLIDTLRTALRAAPAGSLLVGYSGGLDSSVLLHALAQLTEARERGLRAVHVNHGLQPSSNDWEKHCQRVATTLNVPLSVRTATVMRPSDEGLEAAARRARYAAFAEVLGPGELIALAQHRDDQVETVLLKLLRGAGPEGLGAMRTLRKFSQGYLWRPLLNLPRAVLHAYAKSQEIEWIEDPSNYDVAFSRNFLRTEILPRLRTHWPEADTAIAHSAHWQQTSAEFIQSTAQQALLRSRGADPTTLNWRSWLELPGALRDPVLRLWLRELHLTPPTHIHIAELERQLASAIERTPCVRWPGTEVRRYRDLLYAMAPLQSPPSSWQQTWDGAPLVLPNGCGVLHLVSTSEVSTEQSTKEYLFTKSNIHSFTVRFRRGGEKLKPVGTSHTRELRLLFQEAGIPPWQRDRIPLVFSNKELLAVGDLWLSETGHALFREMDVILSWKRCLL